MVRPFLVGSLVFAVVTAVNAAPIKTADTVTDRASFIPLRKQQSLAGKVVGVLVSEPHAVLATEGRSGPKDQMCFGRGGCSYRWVYVPVENNPLIPRLNIRIGEKGSQVKAFDRLSMASPETVKKWDVPGTFALVEVEVNDGLGSPPDDSFVATKMRRLDGTAEFPLKVDEVIADLRRKYDDHLRETAGPVDEAMAKAAAAALKDRKPTGPRERRDVMFVTWLPETDRLRVHFRTIMTDGEYQYANGIKIDLGGAIPTMKAGSGVTAPSRLPNGLKYGKQFGVEFGLAFEVAKSGKVEKTLALPMESFQKNLQQPAVFGPPPAAIPTLKR